MNTTNQLKMEKDQIIACLKALSDPKRIQLLDIIRKGLQCNCDFCDALNLQPNLISHHLRILKDAELVNIEKDPIDSRWIYYSINQQMFENLKIFFNEFMDTSSILPRHQTCGPLHEFSELIKISLTQSQ